MKTKIKSDGQNQPSFIEVARRAQIVECAIETLATLGYAQTSLAQIAKRVGINKGVITYHFTDKDDLLEQVVISTYAAGALFMTQRIEAQSTATSMLRTYIQTNIEFIASHRLQVIAVAEIMGNLRTADGKLRYDMSVEEPVLADLERILSFGQSNGEFRPFKQRVVALAIRRAIDALPHLLATYADFDVDSYMQELVTLFERAIVMYKS